MNARPAFATLLPLALWTAALPAQQLQLRAAVVPGCVDTQVTGARPGALVAMALGQAPAAVELPGLGTLGLDPVGVPVVGVADGAGCCSLRSLFPIGRGAGQHFALQMLALDLAGPPNLQLSPVRALQVPRHGAPARVLVLFGQSNAEGYADRHALPTELRVSLPEARVWNEAAGRWEALLAGRNNTTLQVPGWCGPEMTLVDALTASGEPVWLVKFAVGQTALGPLAGPWNEWAPASQELYAELMRRVRRACVELRAIGLRPTVQGLCMMQGESDATDAALAAGYHARLADLVTTLRADLAAADLTEGRPVPFVLGLVNRDLIPVGFAHADAVRAAQSAVAASLTDVIAVETTGLPVQSDRVHFATPGVMTLGSRFAGALAARSSTLAAMARPAPAGDPLAPR